MSDIDEVKSRLDIVEVINQYVPSLKRAGHSYKGLCPFHKEKTPSFIVTPGLQIYKCFGCGEGGDVLKFIEKVERVDFGEALNIAAERAGYKLTQSQGPQDAKLKQQTEKLLEINELACKYWNYILETHKAGKLGRDYCTKRQIRHEEIKKFRLGYAPKGNNLLPFLQSKGYNVQDLIAAGLVIERNGQPLDKFRDRLVLPIIDIKGNVVGFSGRIVTPSDYAPKYLNSPETLVYKKSEILMGMFQAKDAVRSEKFVILEEGNIDLLSSHKVGVENIIAVGGTALTLQQCKLIKRYADYVYFCFDTDAAGTKALLKGIEMAEKTGLKHKALDLGDYQDPDQLIGKEPKRWPEIVAQPVNTLSHLIKVLQKDLDMGSADGKSEFLQRIRPALHSVLDPVQREHYAGEVAMLVGINKQDVLAGNTQTEVVKSKETVPAGGAEVLPAKPETSRSAREIYIISLLLQLPNFDNLDLSTESFQDVNCREVATQILHHQLNATKSDNFLKLAENLSEGGREILQQALAMDITDVEDPKAELLRMYKIIYANYVRSQILHLRQKLNSNPEDTDTLQKLNYYIQELNHLSK